MGQSRRGFTLVDATVAMSLVALLCTILIPGCFYLDRGGHRNAARRSQCKNNLKQLGLALHNYHDVNNTLPPGWIAVRRDARSFPQPTDGTVRPDDGAFGWNTMILPYFDQAPLFQKFDFNALEALGNTGNAELAATVLPSDRCPSDVGPEKAGSSEALFATTNYVANFGVGLPDVYGPERPALVHGVFGCNPKVRFRDLKDGTSNVLFVGERRMPQACTQWPVGKVGGTYCSAWTGIMNVNTMSPLSIVGTMTGGSLSDNTRLNRSGPLAGIASDELTSFGLNQTPDGEIYDGGDLSSQPITAGFSSHHTGGCHVLLGDGTVRFINENIDHHVLVNMARRSDGETLGEF